MLDFYQTQTVIKFGAINAANNLINPDHGNSTVRNVEYSQITIPLVSCNFCSISFLSIASIPVDFVSATIHAEERAANVTSKFYAN